MDDPRNAYDLASAARARGAVVAVNGGYFTRIELPSVYASARERKSILLRELRCSADC
jgi:hypothetical protein